MRILNCLFVLGGMFAHWFLSLRKSTWGRVFQPVPPGVSGWAVHCRPVAASLPFLHLLPAAPPPSCGNQKCLQTLLAAPWGTQWPQLRTTDFEYHHLKTRAEITLIRSVLSSLVELFLRTLCCDRNVLCGPVWQPPATWGVKLST